MKNEKQIVLVHDAVDAIASQQDSPSLQQARAVGAAVRDLGYFVEQVPVGCRPLDLLDRLGRLEPALVFNLAASLAGHDRLVHLIPSLLDAFRIRYTGTGSDALYLTANKLLTKSILSSAGFLTPRWQSCQDILRSGLKLHAPFILKPVWNKDSRGLDDSSVFYSERRLLRVVTKMNAHDSREWFAEQFIEGREFNVSLLAHGYSAEILPAAEMRFMDFPPGKPPILGYAATRDSTSFEYAHTRRQFAFAESDDVLIAQLETVAYECWSLFSLSGYACVDFRVDERGYPYVLEINGNPSLAPGSCFVDAARQKGIGYAELVKRIIHAALDS